MSTNHHYTEQDNPSEKELQVHIAMSEYLAAVRDVASHDYIGAAGLNNNVERINNAQLNLGYAVGECAGPIIQLIEGLYKIEKEDNNLGRYLAKEALNNI